MWYSQHTNMRNIKTIFSLFGLAFLLLSAFSFAQAGTYSTLNVIGFSKDGKFMAFEEYGTGDGSGYPYVNIFFINVEKNSYAAEPYRLMIENENSTETIARNKAKLATEKKLKELKIIRGNMGKHLVSRLLTDIDVRETESDTTPVELRFSEEVGSMYKRGDYTLKLTPSEVTTKDCEGFGFPTFKFELSLRDNEAKKTIVLQKDNDLPKGRGCALGYRIQDIFLYERNLVVFISVYKPGFEGPDMDFMAVAGKLN